MHEYSSQHHLPTHPEVPASERHVADEVAREHLEHERLANERRARESEEVLRAVERGLAELVGDDAYGRFRHLLWSERMHVRSLFEPPEGLTVDPGEVQQARKNRANALLEELGVAPARLAELFSEAQKRWTDVLLRHPLHGELEDVHDSERFFDLFPDLRFHIPQPSPADRHAFTVFRPPYGGWQTGWGFGTFGGDYRAGHRNSVQAATGLIGQDVWLDNDDAGDFDSAYALADAQVAFWYRPPAKGRLEIVLEAQNLVAAHHLCTEDEYGPSESSTGQTNYLMMHVVHPNVSQPTLGWTSNFSVATDETMCVDRDSPMSGKTYTTHLFSEGEVPARQWVVIRAGTRTILNSFSNDVEIHSSSRFQWLIRRVAVRVEP